MSATSLACGRPPLDAELGSAGRRRGCLGLVDAETAFGDGGGNVPHVLAVNLEAGARHGADGRNTIGPPTSHGCRDLPLAVAASFSGWTPLGTPALAGA